MRGGKLRHLVTIRQVSETQSASGAPTSGTFVKHSNFHADVEDLSGSELMRARQVSAEASVQVTMRHLPRLKSKDQIVFGDRTLHILHISRGDNRQRETVCLCREAV